MSKEMKNVIKESVRKSLGDKVGIREAIGLFKKKPIVKPSSTDFPSSANDWDKRARSHQKQAQMHATASHEYGEEGNNEAEDLHDKAAKAHRLAHDALHFGDDKEGYKKIAKRADDASREANFFVKESIGKELKESVPGDDIHHAFNLIARRYQDKQTDTKNVPSAPNTSKFIAPAHGMIQHLQNVQVAREHPFRPHHFDHFIKIGSNVDPETKKNIMRDVRDYLIDADHTSVDYKGNPTEDLGKSNMRYMRTIDLHGNPYTVSTVSGTAWGGIGIRKGHE